MDSPERSKLYFIQSKLLWLAFVMFAIAGIINQNVSLPNLNLNKQQTAINFNKDLLIFLSAGNKRLITDLLWVQTLLESDIEHYSKRDLSNWMFIRFNTIATLDPLFYENYVWGGQYLSIVKDDLLGAVKLMEKGTEFFPHDYKLLSGLGFTYYFELGDYEKGLTYMERVQNHPKAPSYFPSIVMKLKAELGFDINVLIDRIVELINVTKDEAFKKRLTSDYHALKSERDITCLNSGNDNCDLVDAHGHHYVKIGEKYYTRTSFIPYRLKKKGDTNLTKAVHTI